MGSMVICTLFGIRYITWHYLVSLGITLKLVITCGGHPIRLGAEQIIICCGGENGIVHMNSLHNLSVLASTGGTEVGRYILSSYFILRE